MWKKEKSQRNRHTGRINAAKERILTTGESMKCSSGHLYRYITNPVKLGSTGVSRSTQIVRMF